ncbi:MAG: hypothetical protein ACMXYG_00890 [Candidatus Woesearchaeota archaeon]
MTDKKFEGDELLFESGSKKSKHNHESEGDSNEDSENKSDKEVSAKKTHSKSAHNSKKPDVVKPIYDSKRIIEKNDYGISFNYKHLNPFFFERIFYIIIILILVLLLFRGFSFPSFSSGSTDLDDEHDLEFDTNVSNITDDVLDTPSNRSGKWGIISQECVELTNNELNFYPNRFDSESECAVALLMGDASDSDQSSADCSPSDSKIELFDIRMTGDNRNVIDQMRVRITNNDNKILNGFMIELRLKISGEVYVLNMLGSSSTNFKSDYSSMNINPCGGTREISLMNDLVRKILPPRDSDFTFEIFLYDLDQKQIADSDYILRKI